MKASEQGENLEEIYSKLNQYEGLMEIVYAYDTDQYYKAQKKIFVNHLQPFRGLFSRLGMDIDEEFLQKERITEQMLDSLFKDSLPE